MLDKKSSPTTTPIKHLIITYKAALKLAWKVDKKVLSVITVANSLNGLLVLPSLYITKALIDTVLRAIIDHDLTNNLKFVSLYLFLEFLIFSAKSAFERLDWVFSDNLAKKVSVAIQISSLEKINKLSVKDAESPKIRNLFKKVYDQSGRRAWGMIMPVSYLPFLIFSIISSSVPILTSFSVFIIPVLVFALPEIFVGRKYSKREYEISTKQAHLWRVYTAYDEFISKGRYIYENKILGNTKKLIDNVSKLANKSFEEIFGLRLSFGKKRFAASLPLGVVNLVIKIWLYGQAIIGKITLGTAQMQLQAIGQLTGNISSLGRQVNEIYENYLYVHDYLRFIDLNEEDLSQGKKIETPFKSGVIFKNVWFKYPSSTNWILKGVNFEIEKNDNIAIVGSNGAGKTTLIKLLCGYYKPQKGKIIVNGKDIQQYSLGDYRTTLSALFQDFAQYPFSAKENIAYGDIRKFNNTKAIKKAAEMVDIDRFIESLPQKYDNPLDIEFEKGVEPSKGQWQRLGLARALFRDVEIFILDEPTSNVDPQAEEEIFEKIIKLAKDKIIFLTSHRFSTVRKADKILVLAKGKTIEYGTHEELMSQKGKYSETFNKQAIAYK
ncbi:ABC transporter ATP-binding protein [Candidatus Microgenomates bacterium]|nr:ABC transporter ATP-binding protein [Candidatus Microgenomates bacterium]